MIIKTIKSATKKVLRKIRQGDIIYHIDSPSDSLVVEKKITIDGWVVSKSGKQLSVIIVNNKKEYIVERKISRADVASSLGLSAAKKKCGFSKQINIQDGQLNIYVDDGKHRKIIFSKHIIFSPEKLAKYYYNPRLATNMAEHLNLIDNRKRLYFEKPNEGKYVRDNRDPRLVAMYLPQFHPIKQNDEVWGKGFTEWTNVTAAVPRFIGHQQPLLPKDLGFYDLRDENVIKEQFELAEKFGINGLCFYYYWFSGEKILDTPINTLIEHKDWNYNFAICWANENWTKRWDGRDSEVIIAQKYLESDPLNFIKDVEHIITDDRYIKFQGKPILMVYRASELKDPEKYAKIWRNYIKEKYHQELHLISVISFEAEDPRSFGFDAAMDFTPLGYFFKLNKMNGKTLPYIDVQKTALDPNFAGSVVDYREIVLNKELIEAFDFPTHKCVMPSWDNDARKKGKGFVYHKSSPDVYYTFLRNIIKNEKEKQDEIVFINAWNEWAEGTVLEPSQHLGHSILNRTLEAISAESHNTDNAKNNPSYNIKRSPDTELAVIIHLYHTERWKSIVERLKLLENIKRDIFITINERDEDFIKTIKKFDNRANVMIVPNRGRDVLPFLTVARRVQIAGYKNILKIHSKKTHHRVDGNDWFNSLLSNLVPESDQKIKSIINTLNKHKGFVGPKDHYVNLNRYMGSNQTNLNNLLNNCNILLDNHNDAGFFAGTMFWVNVDALEPFLDLHLMPEDFDSESGQIDGTLAHALERALCYKSSIAGRIYTIDSNYEIQKGIDPTTKYRFAA